MSFGRQLKSVGRTIFPFSIPLKLNWSLETNFLLSVRTLVVNHSVTNPKKLSSHKHFMRRHHAFKSKTSGCDILLPTPLPAFSTFEDSNDDPSGHVFKLKKKMGSLKSNAKRADWIWGEELISNIISEKGNDKWTHEDWIELSKKLSEFVTGSWEFMCMIQFFNSSNMALASSLMDFVQSRPEEPSQVFMAYFIGLLGATSNGDLAQEDRMKSYYDDFISKSDVLDSRMMEVLAKGLSHTRYYKECLDLVSKAKVMDTSSTMLLVNTLLGGIRNHDNQLCAFVLDQFNDPTSSGYFLQLFHKIVDEALKWGNKDGLQLFLAFTEQLSLTPKKSELLAVMESFEKGQCSVCRQPMEKVFVSDQDFKAVQSAFLDQVIVSENIFYKSSPEEVQSFISFVAENGPFDVVIDGLNVLFVDSSGRHKKTPNSFMLSKIESHFAHQGLNVLILGSRYLRKSLQGVIYESAIYTTATTEADDAFFLYAALHSGKNTLIVSGDKLRDHKFRLEPSLRPIFHRWLKSAQVFEFYIDKRTNKIVLKTHQFNLGPVEDASGWHLPFDDVTKFMPFGRNGVLCLRHGLENFPSQARRNNKRWKERVRGPMSKPRGDIPWYKE